MALRMAEVPVSRSTSTVRPWCERASEKLMAKVVLPTPPLPEEIGMIRLMATLVGDFAGSVASGRSTDGDGGFAAKIAQPVLPSSFYRKFTLFAELDERELASIATVAKTRRYAKDDAVFHADESGDVFYLIREGQVKVTMISPEGKEIILSILGVGDFFGEMALFDNEPRSATVIAIEPLEIVSIWRSDFLHILSENFSITQKVL